MLKSGSRPAALSATVFPPVFGPETTSALVPVSGRSIGTAVAGSSSVVEEVNRLAAADEIKTSWANNGAEFGKLTPVQFGAFVAAEVQRWAVVVKASGAKLD